MKIQSGSTCPLADRHSDEVLKALLELYSNRTEGEGDMFWKHKISKLKKPSLSAVLPNELKKQQKKSFIPFLKQKISLYTAAKLKALTCTPSL